MASVVLSVTSLFTQCEQPYQRLPACQPPIRLGSLRGLLLIFFRQQRDPALEQDGVHRFVQSDGMGRRAAPSAPRSTQEGEIRTACVSVRLAGAPVPPAGTWAGDHTARGPYRGRFMEMGTAASANGVRLRKRHVRTRLRILGNGFQIFGHEFGGPGRLAALLQFIGAGGEVEDETAALAIMIVHPC
jgi:hypothetical protein